MKKLVMAGFILLLVACKRDTGSSEGIVFWTPSPSASQTPIVIIHTTTPIYTYTPIVKEVTSTPKPEYLCVTAIETVHLRPSPSLENYPITVLKNGERLMDLGGRDKNEFGDWAFVSSDEKQGWINLKYLINCK